MEDTGDGTLRNPDQRVLQKQFPTAIACRIVEVRDTPCCETSDNTRVIRLPPAIVALANHGIGERVPKPRFNGSGPLVEITRILFEQRWQYGAPDKRTGEIVGLRRAEAPRVTLCSLPISRIVVCCLLNPRQGAHAYDGDEICR